MAIESSDAILTFFGSTAGALAAYVAVKTDIATLVAKVEQAREDIKRLDSRIDRLDVEKETKPGALVVPGPRGG